MIDRHSYLKELAALLAVDVETLTEEYVLQNSQLWDSLSIVSTIASINNHYHVTVKGEEVEKCHTVGDIFRLIEKNSERETRRF